VLLICLLALAAPARGAGTAPVVSVTPYAGRHRADPRFRAGFDGLQAAVRRGLRAVRTRLGLVPRGPGRIEIVVRDADPGRFGGDEALCTTVWEAGRRHQRVVLFAEYVVSGDAELPVLVTHELVHALMRDAMAPATYAHLPHWVREGLAVVVAGGTWRQIQRNLVACRDVQELFTGLGPGPRTPRLYPYAALAVTYLAERGGPGALARFVAGLARGEDPGRRAGCLCGGSWAEFQDGVRAFARARIERAAAGVELVRRAQRLFRDGRYRDARAVCARFLRAHPQGALAPTARYLRARSWFLEGRYGIAESAFRDALRRDRGRSGWSDECQLFLGISLCQQARTREGVEALRAYLDLHPRSSQRAEGRQALGRALGRLGRGEASAHVRTEG
jgi:hypothetical protein